VHAHGTAPAPPRFEINAILRTHGPAFRTRHALSPQQHRVLRDLERCRTAALGGHLYQCDQCAAETVLYNSCLNRHCSTCQGPAQFHWIAQRQKRLLATAYFHLVFTLPAQLRPLARACPQLLFDLLFSAAAQTLLAFGHDPQWLGAQIGFTLVLHTWTRDLRFHPHVHGIVTGGGLTPDAQRWLSSDPDFLFPVEALSPVFRGKFLEALIDRHEQGALDNARLTPTAFRTLTRRLSRLNWVVYSKPSFAGPDHILNYLGRYTHRVALSNSRLLSVRDDLITFRTRGAGTCSLPPDQFIRRFLLHVLPDRFVKIRHYGLLAPANVNTRLARAQQLLASSDHNTASPTRATATSCTSDSPAAAAPDEEAAHPSAAAHLPRCPHCGTGRLVLLGRPGPRGYRHRRNDPPPFT